MEINKMSLKEWRQELLQRHDINKLFDPICDEIVEYLQRTNLQLGASVLAAEFKVSPQKMNLLLKALIILKRVACDPSVKRNRKYWIDPEYKSKNELEDKSSVTAKDAVLNLKPTTLSANDKKALQNQIKRLQCYIGADALNKDHKNHMLISFDENHVMVQYAPTKEKFDRIKAFLAYVDRFPGDSNV